MGMLLFFRKSVNGVIVTAMDCTYFLSLPQSPLGCSTNSNLEIEYQEVGPGLEGEILRSRIEREKQSLREFMEVTSREFSHMEELHKFLYTRHKAYSSSRLLRDHDVIDPTVKQSY